MSKLRALVARIADLSVPWSVMFSSVRENVLPNAALRPQRKILHEMSTNISCSGRRKFCHDAITNLESDLHEIGFDSLFERICFHFSKAEAQRIPVWELRGLLNKIWHRGNLSSRKFDWNRDKAEFAGSSNAAIDCITNSHTSITSRLSPPQTRTFSKDWHFFPKLKYLPVHEHTEMYT